MLGFNICVETLKIESKTNFFNKFINTFIFNYWLIFILWLIGKNKYLFVLDCFLVFLKFFIFGLVFIVNLKSQNLLSYLKILCVDALLYYPLLICFLYYGYNFHYKGENKFNYDTLLIICTICCLIYSIICGFIGSSL